MKKSKLTPEEKAVVAKLEAKGYRVVKHKDKNGFTGYEDPGLTY